MITSLCLMVRHSMWYRAIVLEQVVILLEGRASRLS